MSEIIREVRLPLDGRFLRRECPFCRRQFKVAIPEEELQTLTQSKISAFLLGATSTGREAPSEERQEVQLFCPYCGQQAERDQWWTDEQAAYLQVIVENIIAEPVNRNLVRPLRRSIANQKTGSVWIRFEGRELAQKEEWIAPETYDMAEVHLPCCDRVIKVQEQWPATVFCPFCGFPHRDLLARGGGSACSG